MSLSTNYVTKSQIKTHIKINNLLGDQNFLFIVDHINLIKDKDLVISYVPAFLHIYILFFICLKLYIYIFKC